MYAILIYMLENLVYAYALTLFHVYILLILMYAFFNRYVCI